MDRYHGVVKWFRDNKGYGFISVLGRLHGEMELEPGRELFVHHSDVHPESSTYKTLIKGEYVSFVLKHRQRADETEIQAADVRGAYGGPLMCDGTNVGSLTRMEHSTVPTVLASGDIMFAPGDEPIL